MLKTDRPITYSKLEALNKTENLAKSIIKTVNDENKIPKRKSFNSEQTKTEKVKKDKK